MPKGTAPPLALAILLCDDVLRTLDGKNSLIGVFFNANSPLFPVTFPRFYLYAKLADGNGEYHLRFDYVDVTKNKRLASVSPPMPLRWEDLTQPAEVVIQNNQLVIPHEGRFEFRLYANDMFLGHTTLYVKKITPAQSGETA